MVHAKLGLGDGYRPTKEKLGFVMFALRLENQTDDGMSESSISVCEG